MGLFQIQQRLVDEPLVGADHVLQRCFIILKMPLQNQGDLGADKSRQNKGIRFQLGRIEIRQEKLIFHLDEMDALIHHSLYKVVPDHNVQKLFLLLPVRQIAGNQVFHRGSIGNIGGQRQEAGMELAADDGPEAAVLIGKIVIKGLPGDAQLMAQVGNADGRIGPLMEILQKTVFNLFLTAVGGCGTGNLCIIHVSHL